MLKILIPLRLSIETARKPIRRQGKILKSRNHLIEIVRKPKLRSWMILMLDWTHWQEMPKGLKPPIEPSSVKLHQPKKPIVGLLGWNWREPQETEKEPKDHRSNFEIKETPHLPN